MRTVIYPVKDLTRAKELYGALLGVTPSMDEAYNVGFSIEGQEVGLDPHGHSQGMTGPVGGWRRGAARGQRCRWGKLIATVKDGNSNIIGFIQPP
jgi:hypothetical protein